MRIRNLSNAIFVTRNFPEKNIVVHMFHQFMRTKNPSNATFVIRNFPEKIIVVYIFHQFMEKHLVI